MTQYTTEQKIAVELIKYEVAKLVHIRTAEFKATVQERRQAFDKMQRDGIKTIQNIGTELKTDVIAAVIDCEVLEGKEIVDAVAGMVQRYAELDILERKYHCADTNETVEGDDIE